MNLSPHFTLAEMTRTSSGIKNEPGPAHIENLRALCEELLEPLRAALGAPVRVTSGYRDALVNARIGGAKNSRHMLGLAADVKSPAGDAAHILRVLYQLDLLELDQAIGYDSAFGGQVHIGLAPVGVTPRRQYLWRDADGYRAWRP